MKILITGSNGLLGQKVVSQLKKCNHPFMASSQGENRNPDCPDSHYVSLDITNQKEVNEVMDRVNLTHVIHTAALTNVDECELHPQKCHEINVNSTNYLFEACKSKQIHFQLLSTDFVFDGKKGNYNEKDEVAPLSEYGRSKMEAENILRQSNYTNWSIVRTIIVYGTAKNLSRSNLLLWIKNGLEKQEKMSVINDQFRSPTWADDLAWGCIRICTLHKTGIYHLSGPEIYSIDQVVKLVADYYQLPMHNVTIISSEQLNQPAKRPPKTGFDLTKSINELGYRPKKIIETLDLF